MTNGEFISSQLQAYGITDADLMTIADSVELDSALVVADAEKAMIPLVAKAAMAPFRRSVSENGFSVSWDTGKVGWWYNYLCSKYGVRPDANVLAALGMSVITDRTSKW